MSDESLTPIYGLSAARRSLLAAAGVTSTAALARASIEQIVSITGMTRAAATALKRRAAAAAAAAKAEPEEDSATATPDADEAFPTVTKDGGVTADGEAAPPAPDEENRGEPEDQTAQSSDLLERALVKMRTALSDATRRLELPRIARQIVRFARLMDDLPRRAERLKPGRRKTLVKRLDAAATFLEKCAAAGAATSSKAEPSPKSARREERMRDRLKAERRAIAEIVGAAAPAKPRKKKKK